MKHERFGNIFEFRFSGDALRPQHMTICMQCQNIVCVDVMYVRETTHEPPKAWQLQQRVHNVRNTWATC